jgi:hypothetical protein
MGRLSDLAWKRMVRAATGSKMACPSGSMMWGWRKYAKASPCWMRSGNDTSRVIGSRAPETMRSASCE